MSESEMPKRKRKRIIISGVAMTLLLGAFVASMLLGVVGTVEAQAQPQLYNNSSADVANESWMQGRQDPTMANVTNMLTRVSTFVVGSGATGGGPVGALVTGILIFGLTLGVVGASRVGFVAGGTLGVVSTYGIFSAGLFPAWLWGLLLFAVGVVAAAVFIRALR